MQSACILHCSLQGSYSLHRNGVISVHIVYLIIYFLLSILFILVVTSAAAYCGGVFV